MCSSACTVHCNTDVERHHYFYVISKSFTRYDWWILKYLPHSSMFLIFIVFLYLVIQMHVVNCSTSILVDHQYFQQSFFNINDVTTYWCDFIIRKCHCGNASNLLVVWQNHTTSYFYLSTLLRCYLNIALYKIIIDSYKLTCRH